MFRDPGDTGDLGDMSQDEIDYYEDLAYEEEGRSPR